MSAVRKFAFDTVFSPEGEIVRDGVDFRTQFTAAEMAAARAEAFAEGQAASESAARAALAALAADMAAVLARLETETAILREDAAALALAAARKVADIALAAHGEARVLAAIEDAMALLPHAPRILIRLAPSLAEAVQPRLEALRGAQLHEGALIVRADDTVPVGDLALEWAEGAVLHDRAGAFTLIEETIARVLAQARQEENA